VSQVILVNEKDQAIGSMDKLEVHQKGLLHRAFSIFIFNDKGEMLIQQRALLKYHSGGLWTNACCSHPFPGEETGDAAHRRLKEEMGFDTKLSHVFSFSYHASFENGLTEHEFDHVFIGVYNGRIEMNEAEVMNYEYVPSEILSSRLEANPTQFTAWFRIAFPKLQAYLATTNT
jgi:isopentenyl-diphosphate Delta-isomerase